MMVAGVDLFARAVQRARLGQFTEAEELCRELLRLEPEHASAQGLLGLLQGERGNPLVQGRLCVALGRPDQAVEILREACQDSSEQALALALLGTAYRLRGEAAEALRCYESALALEPEQGHAQVGLAVLTWQKGNSRTALDRLQSIVESSPDNLDAQMALGDLLFDCGDYIGAVRHLGRLLETHPHLIPSRQALARCLSRKPLAVLALENERQVEESYDHPDIEVEHLAQASVVLLLRRPRLQILWSLNTGLEAGEAMRSGRLQPVLEDTFLQRVISAGVLSDLTIERGLTALRWAVLERLQEPGQLTPELTATAQALALNGWHSEFVYAVSPQENAMLESLASRQDLAAALGQAMYAPLTRAVEGLEQLVLMHLTEPALERELALEIPSLTPVSHAVSAAVSRQYEENPYPRWRSLTRTTRMRLGHGLQAFFPYWKAPDLLARPRLLVAGCGTGRDLLTLAATWETSGVVGVDLSRASLAHARRMAGQLGMDEVELYQADLLALGDWPERFDTITCTGVLHHMEDPVAGWRVLSSLLRPGGVMKIALYSERARNSFVAAQEWVRERRIPPTPEGIRQARQELAALPQDDPAWGATTVRDFYYLSGCRDLIFHVQEHRFTITKIAELLPQLGLRFLGFETSGETRLTYDRLFPHDPRRVDLLCWGKFEELYPTTFLTMYQFWCQKIEDGPSEKDPGDELENYISRRERL